MSAIAMQREGDSMLFDCGEGTQRQMMRYGTGFSLDTIFITHMHADHFLGVVGLLRTMALQGRTEGMTLYGPPGSRPLLEQAVNLGVERVRFPLRIEELRPGQVVERSEYEIRAFPVEHGTSAVGYTLREYDRPGRFDVDRARELGVPEGPLFGRLHAGETVEVDDRMIHPDEVVGPPRPGRTVVYTGDTRPAASTLQQARGAQLLIHDATFTEEERERALDTRHATAREAGELAREAGVDRLVLTHVSARYSENARPLEREARKAFPDAVAAYDGYQVEIPYADAPDDR